MNKSRAVKAGLVGAITLHVLAGGFQRMFIGGGHQPSGTSAGPPAVHVDHDYPNWNHFGERETN